MILGCWLTLEWCNRRTYPLVECFLDNIRDPNLIFQDILQVKPLLFGTLLLYTCFHFSWPVLCYFES
jgi:hypothetical protein